MGISFKTFVGAGSGAQAKPTQASAAATAAAATSRVETAHRRLADVKDRLESVAISADPWGGPSAEEHELQAEKGEAKKELASALKAFKKATGKAYVAPPRPRPPPASAGDGYRAGRSGGERPAGADRGPTPPPPPPDARPRATPQRSVPVAGARAGAQPSGLGADIGAVLGAKTYASREAIVGRLNTRDLAAAEANLVVRLRSDPGLHSALAAATHDLRAFNRALFSVHPDKNRPQAERSLALADLDPEQHRANVDAFLAKLDGVRNLLNAGRRLVEAHRFPSLDS